MAEWKHHSVDLSGVSSTTLGVTDITAIPQGDTDITRDGDQLFMGSISFFRRWTAGDDVNVGRFIIFQWFPATVPVGTDILNTNFGFAPVYHYDTDRAYQYKILFDSITTVNNNFTGQNKETAIKRMKVRPKRKKIQFIAGGTTGTNKIYVLTTSDSVIATHPSIDATFRVNYMDA